ncbi:DUF4760 domain-containing protein [Paractinoplanes durhamensis]|uniref:DUF4760 domain-containing protein n=1 Tax=Paractinoplanes durhamensis TaxID=113563 RepID=A0ABQ3YRF5_9ACTN|nr:hypothetical protein [Actinoplanes durhamensis]GIE00100.1 hypothetical protein Adu01nite_14500 [Actinoplanes durhamensis]
MDAAILLNFTAIVISAAALGASLLIGLRQVRAAHQQVHASQESNNTLVAIELLTQECRSEQFLESEAYVVRHLADDHSPERGVDGLPVDAWKHATRMGLYYSSLGIMSKLGAIDQALLISSTHYRVRRCWKILEPYILREREIRKSTYMAYFEHLAAVAGDADLPGLHRELGLEQIGSRSAEFAAEFDQAAVDRAPAPARRRRLPVRFRQRNA